jgi:uncharacterized protein YdcH (DUF465 family)
MFGKTLQDRAAEQAEIQLRQRALTSLVSMRNKLLRESLDHRIKRAIRGGVWTGLPRAECARLHKQEKVHLREQLAELLSQRARAQGKLIKSRRAMARARALRAAGHH